MTTQASSRSRGGLRALFGALSTVPRRARRDAGFLAAYLALTAVVASAALAAPIALTRSADAGLRSAVALAGPAADVRVDYRLPGNLAHPEAFADRVVAAAAAGLPDGLRAAVGNPTGSLWISPVAATRLAEETSDADPLDIALGHVAGAAPTWIDGTDPAQVREEVVGEARAGISADTADATGLTTGDRVTLALREPVTVRITGVFEPVRPSGGLWTDLPGVLAPIPADGAGRPPIATLLVPRDSLPVLFDAGARAERVSVRFTPDPEHLTTDRIESLGREVAGATDGAGALTLGASSPVPAVSTQLGDVLERYAARLDTARAQSTTVLMGVAVSGGLVLVLAAGLLAGRRREVLDLERSRGASAWSVLIRAAIEAVLVALGAGVLAVAGATATAAVLPGGLAGRFGDGAWWLPGAVVLAAAAVAPVFSTALDTIATSTGPRRAANRSDRVRWARARAAWRGWAEAAVVLLAVAGVAGAWSRGLVPGGDLLLAAAPALVAASCTVLVLRVVPVVARSAARAASRGTGLIGLVAASRAATRPGDRGRRRAASPVAAVLAVTMTTALAVSCAAAATTVRAAQAGAADVVVGAQARIDRPSDELAAAALAPRSGVTAAAGTVFGSVAFGGQAGIRATVLALDAAAFDHLAPLADPAAGDGIRAHLPQDLADVADRLPSEIYVQGTTVPLRVADSTDVSEHGPAVSPLAAPGLPVIMVDRSALAAALDTPADELDVDTVWLSGPGAADAAGQLARGSARPGETASVLTRDDHERRQNADLLTEGLLTLYTVGAGALLLLGAAAIALTVQATAAARARAWVVLRTVGVPARRAARLAVAELAPTLGAAVLAGLGAGVLTAALLTSAQGLGLLAGGGEPALRLAWWPFAAAVGAGIVVLATSAWLEARSRRQIRIGEVLRTW